MQARGVPQYLLNPKLPKPILILGFNYNAKPISEPLLTWESRGTIMTSALIKTIRTFTVLIGGLSSILLITGCAGVTVTPLTADGTKDGTEEGVRYYMPMPYLLVTELPPSLQKTTTDTPDNQDLEEKKQDQAATPSANKDNGNETTSDPAKTTSSPAPMSDTSFSAQTPQYMIKLIYLPDLKHPMAISEHTGLFGSAEMKPALQDGWMLSSLDAPADNKTAETITAMASLVSATAGAVTGPVGAVKSAAKAAGQRTLQSLDLTEMLKQSGSQILRPGLYRFVYEKGNLMKLEAVSYFSGAGILQP